MSPSNPNAPANLFDNMLSPLIGYGIRGVIWYQGESNANHGEADRYHELFAAMIEDWRERWGDDFPFYFLQLANYSAGMDREGISSWAVLRERQTQTLKLPRTGMAVTIDIGEAADIHPRNKLDVGRRLARVARHFLYGEKDLEYAGPMCRQVIPDGNGLRLDFAHAESGLVAGARWPEGFEVAAENGRFIPAKAALEGGQVLVTAPGVPGPVTVRYAWSENPPATLFNGAGLPAVPFRLSVGESGVVY